MTDLANYELFTPFKIGDLTLKNRIVLSPLTRARSDPVTRAPNEMNADYYARRAGAGLIFTEASAVSEQGYGWYGAPALYNEDHVAGWKRIVDRVHERDGKILLQLWHMGRLAHSSFNAKREVVSASNIGPAEGRLRDANGEPVSYEVPRALTTEEIPGVVEDYRKSAELAKRAGFDGVEVHTVGYLPDQFIQRVTNNRTDKYGGSLENRARFLLEIIDALKTVWPAGRIGVRVSPNGAWGGMGESDNIDTYNYVLSELDKKGVGFIAIHDGVGFGHHDKCRRFTVHDVRKVFHGTVIATNSLTRDIAEGVVRSGAADAVGFGRLFISNPDLAERFQNDWPLEPLAPHEHSWDASKGAEGYIDYEAYSPESKGKRSPSRQ